MRGSGDTASAQVQVPGVATFLGVSCVGALQLRIERWNFATRFPRSGTYHALMGLRGEVVSDSQRIPLNQRFFYDSENRSFLHSHNLMVDFIWLKVKNRYSYPTISEKCFLPLFILATRAMHIYINRLYIYIYIYI